MSSGQCYRIYFTIRIVCVDKRGAVAHSRFVIFRESSNAIFRMSRATYTVSRELEITRRWEYSMEIKKMGNS